MDPGDLPIQIIQRFMNPRSAARTAAFFDAEGSVMALWHAVVYTHFLVLVFYQNNRAELELLRTEFFHGIPCTVHQRQNSPALMQPGQYSRGSRPWALFIRGAANIRDACARFRPFLQRK